MTTKHVGYLIIELRSFFRLGGNAPFDPVLEQKKAADLITEKLHGCPVPYQLKKTLNGELLLTHWGSMKDLMDLYNIVRQLEGTVVERMKLYIVPEAAEEGG